MSKVREDLVVPYHHFPAKPRGDASTMISQSLPMAAMFMRNKMLSWASLFLAIQSYLNEPVNKPESPEDAATQPPILRVALAALSLGTCYIDLIFPATNPALKRAAQAAAAATGTAAAA